MTYNLFIDYMKHFVCIQTRDPVPFPPPQPGWALEPPFILASFLTSLDCQWTPGIQIALRELFLKLAVTPCFIWTNSHFKLPLVSYGCNFSFNRSSLTATSQLLTRFQLILYLCLWIFLPLKKPWFLWPCWCSCQGCLLYFPATSGCSKNWFVFFFLVFLSNSSENSLLRKAGYISSLRVKCYRGNCDSLLWEA